MKKHLVFASILLLILITGCNNQTNTFNPVLPKIDWNFSESPIWISNENILLERNQSGKIQIIAYNPEQINITLKLINCTKDDSFNIFYEQNLISKGNFTLGIIKLYANNTEQNEFSCYLSIPLSNEIKKRINFDLK